MRKAFSMVELLFVIVILGIVASIGSEMIANVYKSYIVQRATHTASLKSELAINQIANRLLYRIDKSVLARKPDTNTTILGTTVYPLADIPLSGVDQYSALEWIGYENDGFTQSQQPAWSGFADLNDSNYTKFTTTGSKLTKEQTILQNLSGKTPSDTPAIIFNTAKYRTNTAYNAICMYSKTGCIFPVTIIDDTHFAFTTDGNRTAGQMIYSEFYKLAASAYAIVPENNVTRNGINVFDLILYSNYQPWEGESYDKGDRSILARNVSVFRFRQEPNSIRIKLCTIAPISATDQIATCKEKSVIR
jgi:prepilin-type N-terminal cleavage/methylation domain-containing protein